MVWHLITSEYPPQPGGVSDYTGNVATYLGEQGDEVHVWCPGHVSGRVVMKSVTIHRQLGKFSLAEMRRAGREMNRFSIPRRILLQWVPHGYGYRSMNLGFCLWLWSRGILRRDQIEIVVHEPCLAFGEGSWRQNCVALVHRLMSVVLLLAATRVWVSIPAWEARWKPYTLGRRIPFQWLPIPSNVPVAYDQSRTAEVRKRCASASGLLIGHFGTYGRPVTSMLEPILVALGNRCPGSCVLLMGNGSDVFRDQLKGGSPELQVSISATGELNNEELSASISACDIMIQPYPDGVSSRRTSVMAGLSHGKPIVATRGRLTEPLWDETGAIRLADVGDVDTFVTLIERLLSNACERESLGSAGRRLYDERFAISRVLAELSGNLPIETRRCAS